MNKIPNGSAEELAAASEQLTRILTEALRALGDAGEPRLANTLAGQAWSAIRRVNPHSAQRINGLMHYLAKLEGDGGISRP